MKNYEAEKSKKAIKVKEDPWDELWNKMVIAFVDMAQPITVAQEPPLKSKDNVGSNK